MAYQVNQIIPLTPQNQTLNMRLSIDGQNKTLVLKIIYNGIAGYWFMSVSDSNGNKLLDSVPLLVSDYPANNILEQYSYLQIGSAYVVPRSSLAALGQPNDTNLGTDYVLLWGDTMD